MMNRFILHRRRQGRIKDSEPLARTSRTIIGASGSDSFVLLLSSEIMLPMILSAQTPAPISYEQDIAPILRSHCAVMQPPCSA